MPCNLYSCWNRTPLPGLSAVPGTALSNNAPPLLLLLPLLPARNPFQGPDFFPLLLYGLGTVVVAGDGRTGGAEVGRAPFRAPVPLPLLHAGPPAVEGRALLGSLVPGLLALRGADL